MIPVNSVAPLLPEKWAGNVKRGEGHEVQESRLHLKGHAHDRSSVLGSTLLSVGVNRGIDGMANAGSTNSSITLWHQCDSLDCEKGIYICMCAHLNLLFVASLLGSSKAPLQEPSEDAGEPNQQSRDRE